MLTIRATLPPLWRTRRATCCDLASRRERSFVAVALGPTKDRLLCRLHLVRPAADVGWGCVGGEIRILRLDRRERSREGVERLLALGLGRLHHERLGDHEREVHGW